MNITIFQFFHWYYSPEGNLWRHVAAEAQHIADMGFTHVWLPPAYKSAYGVFEPGYAVYDLYDLGEFDQKGTIRTRYGTKDEYLQAIKALHEAGLQVIADVVFNHMIGGDEKQKVLARTVKHDNRTEFVGEPHETEPFSLFTFPGRKGKYSDYVWDHRSFSGYCEGDEIKLFLNDHTNGQWEEMIGDENGNYDYLMGNDIEFRNPHVREELKKWGCWYAEFTGIDGFRLDAVKHITPYFFNEWLDHMKTCFKKDFMVIGEYWRSKPEALLSYIEATEERIQLFDVPLHFNFYNASKQNGDYDLRTIFDHTLIQQKPHMSISFVDNHDTQPLQALESTVEYWFKPLAYAIILLREQGIPCVFYPALYEAKYAVEKDGAEVYVEMNKVEHVEYLIRVRSRAAYGQQRDYFDDPHLVGWTREGIDEKEYSGCAVLISNREGGEKWMSLGERNAWKVFVNVCCGGEEDKVTLDEKGEGRFRTASKLSVWVNEKAL